MKKILGIAALAIMASSTASAAEYYASFSGLYGKGGHKVSGLSEILDHSKKNHPAGFDIAFGSHITPETRAELSIGYLTGGKKSVNHLNNALQTVDSSTKIQSISLMLNAYYDFKNSSDFTPYLMGGIGYSINKYNYEFANTAKLLNVKFEEGKAKGTTGSFAYQLGLGVDAKVADNVKIGIGYRYRDLGVSAAKIKNTSGKIKIKPAHLALAHVRFEF